MPVALGSATNKPGFPNVARKIIVVVTGSGAAEVTVPHGLSYTPTSVIIGTVYDVAGPLAGPTVNLGVQTVAAGMDGTNVYLFFSGAGTAEIYVG